MKNLFLLILLFVGTSLIANTTPDLTKDFKKGNPNIQSINAMAFGPEGILFIGDSKSAQVIALDLSKHKKTKNEKLGIKNLEKAVIELLGAKKDEIQITDMVVNPANENIYLSVHHSSGKAMLLQVVDNKLENVSLKKVSYSASKIKNPVAKDAKDRRGRALRKWAISDLHYSDGKVYLSGLSNQEFASTFRAVDFPFNEKEVASSLEIYHAAHGKYETHAPIKAFTTIKLNGKTNLLASYTCTPLVTFPLENMKKAQHNKAKTVAELGNWNTPLDIIEMEKEGNRYVLMANSNRALMKIKVTDIEAFKGSLDTRVKERSGTAGVEFINLPFVNVQQLAKLNDKTFVMIQRDSKGILTLKTGGNRWL